MTEYSFSKNDLGETLLMTKIVKRTFQLYPIFKTQDMI